MAGAERAIRLGRLAGAHAEANLVHGALEVADETRAAMIAAFAEAAIIHWRFMEVARDLDAGHALRHEAGVADAAFRPNFNSRKADEFFAAEEWTEAVMRYSMAGETLVREVMTAVAQAVGQPELASTDKLNQFRSLGERVAKQVDVSLAKEPAWPSSLGSTGCETSCTRMDRRRRRCQPPSKPAQLGRGFGRCSQRFSRRSASPSPASKLML